MPYPEKFRIMDESKGDVRMRLESGSDLVVCPEGLTFEGDDIAYDVRIVEGDEKHPKGMSFVFLENEIESVSVLEDIPS